MDHVARLTEDRSGALAQAALSPPLVADQFGPRQHRTRTKTWQQQRSP
jgi:hypothetical protein